MSAHRRDERGGVFVIAAFLLALGLLLVLAIGPLTGAIVARARASAAADAAALAAADQIALGRGSVAACAMAALVARANDARIESCGATNDDAVVMVRVDGIGPIGAVRARARAAIDWARA